MRLVRRLLFVVTALIVVGVGMLLVSSRLSLDTEYGHTRRVEMLQPLSPGTSRGLVHPLLWPRADPRRGPVLPCARSRRDPVHHR